MVSSYDDEMNMYLASLPPLVSNEDVINIQARPAKIFERPVDKREPLQANLAHTDKKMDVVELTTEQQYARNLHLFCMVEHERRNDLLLPDELINVTRRLHTKNKFDNVCKIKLFYTLTKFKILILKKHISMNSILSKSPSTSSMKKSSANGFSRTNTKLCTESAMNDAAQRVFDNLENVAEYRTRPDDSKSVNDSGYAEDSLDSWRLQAENTVDLILCLNMI